MCQGKTEKIMLFNECNALIVWPPPAKIRVPIFQFPAISSPWFNDKPGCFGFFY